MDIRGCCLTDFVRMCDDLSSVAIDTNGSTPSVASYNGKRGAQGKIASYTVAWLFDVGP